MHSSLFTTHRLSARTLYRRRQNLLRQPFSRSTTLHSLEKRLAGHLSSLAQIAEPLPDTAPSCAAEAFVQLAALLLSQNTDFLPALDQWLDEEDSLGEAILDALALCASPSTWRYLDTEAASPARLALQIKAHTRMGQVLSGSDLENALDASASVSLLSAVLEHIGYYVPQQLNVVSAHYHDSDDEIRLASLTAGLRLGDHAASEALLSDIESSTDPTTLAPELLRLGAIALPQRMIPALETLAEQSPKEGLWLLALTGQHAAASVLLAKLQAPRCAEDAAIAWQWISGQALPRRPRLHLVEEQQHSSDDSLPDPAVALQWWQQEKAQWPTTERRAFGIRLDQHSARQLAESWSGQAGDAIRDIAALCYQHNDGQNKAAGHA